MSQRKTQKVINLTSHDGQYQNFFFEPGSKDSLQHLVNYGWIVIFIKDDPSLKMAVVLLEMEI